MRLSRGVLPRKRIDRLANAIHDFLNQIWLHEARFAKTDFLLA